MASVFACPKRNSLASPGDAGGCCHDRLQRAKPGEKPMPRRVPRRAGLTVPLHDNFERSAARFTPFRRRACKAMSAVLVMDSGSLRRARASKVLVAEDHEDTRDLLRTLLERRGLAVVEARDGVEACDVALRERPDLILMDGGLPLLDGFAATRRLRGLAPLSGVPIVFLSGHAGPQYQLDARAAGCDDYVVKPFDVARLESILNRYLQGRRKNEGV